jgi:hypothetical protein
MKVKYIAVWRLYGVSKLLTDGGNNLDLARLDDPSVVSSVTANAEPHFLHIDRSAALATQLLKGLFSPDKNGTPAERLAAELENVKARRAKQTEKGVFLVVEAEKDVSSPNFKTRRDTEEYAVCFDAVDKPEILDSFRPFIQAILTSVVLSLPANADHQIERVGEAIYLVDPDNGKPIYTFSVQGGSARLSVASPLTGEIVAAAGRRVSKVIGDKQLARPTSLLVTSLNRTTDALQAFVAAWSALEIFVNAGFKATYESRWFDIMESGAPVAAKPVFERFKDVMSDKYRLADKFLIIASVLDADAATTDADEFRNLKTVRDNLSHGLETAAHLPTEAVQKLLVKYMALHLDRPT